MRKLILVALLWLFVTPMVVLAASPLPGPPYPQPTNDVVVYDYAGVLTPATEARLTTTITAIEKRVGAEIVVYTQYKPGSTEDSTRSDAKALLDQWGVGRAGFFDGLAILINMTRLPCQAGISGNGQVQLFAGDGYKAAYLSDQERQQIFDDVMVPYLKACDIDNAVLAASTRSTPTQRPSTATSSRRRASSMPPSG